MLRPVGSQPASVYWRRRLLFAASLVALVVLVVLTANSLTSNGSGVTAAGSAASRTPSSPAPSSSLARGPSARTSASSGRSSALSADSGTPRKSGTVSRSGATNTSGTSSTSGTPRPLSPPPLPACTVSALRLRAVAQHASYRVGDQPVLQLQVVNPTSKPCVQDLADRQVELRVYNGESRVWGSHDCKTLPGTTMRTLAPNVAVLVAINWSGRTSQPGCQVLRQPVGTGTYTLYATLAGHTAQAGRFSIG